MVELLKSEIFWNAFSAIATTVTAIVAIIISVVSYKHSNKINLRIKWDWSPRLYDALPHKDIKEIKTLEDTAGKFKLDVDLSVNFVNNGKVSIDIYEYGLFLHHKKNENVDYRDTRLDTNYAKLPFKLQPGESFNFSVIGEHFNKIVKSDRGANDKFYLKIYCLTSSGMYLSSKIKKVILYQKKYVLCITN